MTTYYFSYLIREAMLIISLMLAKKLFPDRIIYPDRIKTIGIIIAFAITVAMIIEELGSRIIRKKTECSYSLLLKAALTELALFCLIFFFAFAAIKHFARMPISILIHVIISLVAGFCHQMISFFFGWTTEILSSHGIIEYDDETDDYYEQ